MKNKALPCFSECSVAHKYLTLGIYGLRYIEAVLQTEGAALPLLIDFQRQLRCGSRPLLFSLSA
jgi:hypothetical protein